jgi:hypothetical protein
MQNNKETRKSLSSIFASELMELSAHLDGMTLSKFIYMFSTGVEMITKNGHISKLPPIGPSLGWMINVFQGKSSPEGVYDPYQKIQFTGELLDDLIKESESNETAWFAAKEIACWYLKEKHDVPKKLHTFLTDEKPKRKRGRHDLENRHRNVCIVMLLNAVENAGFKPVTRNPDPLYGNFRSLCDVMENALEQIGRKLSYAGVRKIWHKRDELNEYIPEFRISIESEQNGKVCYMGYADTRGLTSDLPKEAQKCWMIKKIILPPPVSLSLCLNKGTQINLGNGFSIIPAQKRHRIFKRIQGKSEQKMRLLTLENMLITL